MRCILRGTSDYEGLREALHTHVCNIVFHKKDGDVRIATGTTSLQIIDRDHHPKGKRKPCEATVAFFDLDINEWRSLKTENLIGYTAVATVDEWLKNPAS